MVMTNNHVEGFGSATTNSEDMSWNERIDVGRKRQKTLSF